MPEPVIINIIHDPEYDDTAESLEFYFPSHACLPGFIDSGSAVPFADFSGRDMLSQDPVEFMDTDLSTGPGSGGPVVVTIETGYAFGDGKHATTWLCMKFLLDHLDDISSDRQTAISLLDAGTGTGILAITAALLGVRDIDAVEMYHHAVLFAERNIRTNDCGWVRLHESDLEGYSSAREYDIVTANMVSDVLAANIQKLHDYIAPGGVMIASGVSAGRHLSMIELFRHNGLRIMRQEGRDGWHAYVLKREVRPHVGGR